MFFGKNGLLPGYCRVQAPIELLFRFGTRLALGLVLMAQLCAGVFTAVQAETRGCRFVIIKGRKRDGNTPGGKQELRLPVIRAAAAPKSRAVFSQKKMEAEKVMIAVN